MEMKLECSHCGQHVLVDDWSAGQTLTCPNCGQTITPRPVAPNAPPLAAQPNPQKEIKTNIKQGAAIGGWVCFGVGCIVMFIPFPTWFIYGPLFLASFVLSIVAMSQGRIASGITLLLANVIGGPVLFVIALAFGIATWSSTLQQIAKHSSDLATNSVAAPVPAVAVSQLPAAGETPPPVAVQQSQEDADAKAKAAYIQQHLILYDVEARYMDSELDGRVPGVLFKIRNTGGRSLDMVKVTVTFFDASGAAIHDEDYYPVSVSDFSFGDNKPLKAGYIWQMESGKFYDAKSVPSEWREGSVVAKITDIKFSQN
jgi:DNA-directed RNA polymerase subunit RPC12/RpoP